MKAYAGPSERHDSQFKGFYRFESRLFCPNYCDDPVHKRDGVVG